MKNVDRWTNATQREYTLGEVFCEGNLFRPREASRELYELRIQQSALWLVPVTYEARAFCFLDHVSLLDRFDYIPWN